VLDGIKNEPNSQRRMIWEEPSRLFAHIIVNDRPFSDLVVGDYTVVTSKLQHLYVRSARVNTANSSLDSDEWWRVSDPKAWREVPFARMNPHLLADRSYRFDPRVDDNEPLGVPSAGVLTSYGTLGYFARERVRAARALEIFACRTFVAPSPDLKFNTYQRDPAKEGSCQHCHTAIDPVAIHFKRVYIDLEGNVMFGGIGPWKWNQQALDEGNYVWSRFNTFFVHDTVLTPVDDARLQQKPDARFIDFTPTGQGLFGQSSDETIGPLGFAKPLVESGEFDECAVQHLYEHFIGRALDPTLERDTIVALAERFRSENRRVRPFVKSLMVSDEFRRGW
jgi:hypothetical protein